MNLEANRVVDFSSDQNRLDGTRQSGMYMPFKKVCPQCDATLHVRKLACPCGHVFPAKTQQTKRKRPIESKQSAKQLKEHVKQLGNDRHIIKSAWQALDNVKRVNRP